MVPVPFERDKKERETPGRKKREYRPEAKGKRKCGERERGEGEGRNSYDVTNQNAD